MELLHCPTDIIEWPVPLLRSARGTSTVNNLYLIQKDFTKFYEPWHVPMQYLVPNVYAGKQTFVVVRNPFSRIISAYYCKWNGGYKGLLQQYNNYQTRDSYNKSVAVHHLNAWIQKKVLHWPNEDTHDSHLTPQHLFVYDSNGEKLVDYILYYENLQTEFNALMSQLGLKIRINVNEKVNKGMVMNSIERLQIKDLDENTKLILEEFYKLDFKYFYQT